MIIFIWGQGECSVNTGRPFDLCAPLALWTQFLVILLSPGSLGSWSASHAATATCLAIGTNVVWTFITFDDNFVTKHKFTKYLKESCVLGTDDDFFFKYLLKYILSKNSILSTKVSPLIFVLRWHCGRDSPLPRVPGSRLASRAVPATCTLCLISRARIKVALSGG